MIAGVADTHSAIWYLFDDRRLSNIAGDFIERAAAAGSAVVVSSISLAEIVYLIEKQRLSPNVYTDLRTALKDPEHVFKEVACTGEIVDAMRHVSRTEIRDMPDRIIAAMALYFRVPVISRDERIRASDLQTVW
jgi:PIN domain nuclease of toxin-antitoxin system